MSAFIANPHRIRFHPTSPVSSSPAGSPAFFATAAEFRQWLAAHAEDHTELLVGFHKVGCGKPSMSWPESVDEALCFGWIDGVRKRIDADSYQIRFTPRKPNSIWSVVNIAKFEQLSAQSRTTAAGVAAFAKRREEKSAVYAYEQAQTAQLEAAELAAFKQADGAWSFFETTPLSYQKVMLHWIVVQAKRPETRAARLQKLIQACAAQQRIQ